MKIKVIRDEVTGLKPPYNALLIREEITDLGCPNQEWEVEIKTEDGNRYIICSDSGSFVLEKLT